MQSLLGKPYGFMPIFIVLSRLICINKYASKDLGCGTAQCTKYDERPDKVLACNRRQRFARDESPQVSWHPPALHDQGPTRHPVPTRGFHDALGSIPGRLITTFYPFYTGTLLRFELLLADRVHFTLWSCIVF